jgi:hypothetical protein
MEEVCVTRILSGSLLRIRLAIRHESRNGVDGVERIRHAIRHRVDGLERIRHAIRQSVDGLQRTRHAIRHRVDGVERIRHAIRHELRSHGIELCVSVFTLLHLLHHDD